MASAIRSHVALLQTAAATTTITTTTTITIITTTTTTIARRAVLLITVIVKRVPVHTKKLPQEEVTSDVTMLTRISKMKMQSTRT